MNCKNCGLDNSETMITTGNPMCWWCDFKIFRNGEPWNMIDFYGGYGQPEHICQRFRERAKLMEDITKLPCIEIEVPNDFRL